MVRSYRRYGRLRDFKNIENLRGYEVTKQISEIDLHRFRGLTGLRNGFDS